MKYERFHGRTLPHQYYHNHQYYQRECPLCRQNVNDLFFLYFDDFQRQQLMSRKSSCGHSCLRYAIVFYCTLMVISCICIICYSSRFFGLVTTLMTDEDIPPLLSARLEVYAIILSSIIMLIFFVGLIGSLLESALCLRIFGGIVAYLFLLTFGACLYSVILLMLTNAHIRLLFSIGSFSAALIVCHASIAIAPFVLADDISKRRIDNRMPSLNRFHASSRQSSSSYNNHYFGERVPKNHVTHVRFQDDWL